MDHFPQRPFIAAIAVSGIEAPESQTTHRAAPIVVERGGIDEWRPATHAEEFSFQRGYGRKTTWTNRGSRDYPERCLADPAIVGEQEGETVREDLYREGSNGNRGTGCELTTTGEDPPPPNI
jgi:endonuclease YncB( thermonuclease family)